jgi:long-chain acyl-CoA synthetase
MRPVVFLTGATGFLGAQVARRLLERPDLRLLTLVRAQDAAGAARRLARAWWDWPELVSAIGSRVEVLCGDLRQPFLGLETGVYGALVRQVTHIVHTAAELGLNAPLERLRQTNVTGTANLLELARAIERDHGLARFAHVSTAYVAGERMGTVPEEALTDAFGFSSAYEQSKFEGEQLVQAAKAELSVTVFRPGMIVGDSQSGAVETFNTFYVPLRLYLTGRLWVLPARPDLRVNIVPVDYVADAIARLCFEPGAAGLNLHLTAPEAALPTAAELIDFVRAWASQHLRVNLPRPLFLPLPWLETWARRARGGGLGALSALLPYLDERRRFRRDNADLLLGPYPLEWHDFMPKLLEFAVACGFMHRSERTVHEQVLYRLEGHGPPVTYHDMIEGKPVPRDALEVRADMLRATGALRVLGVQPGDRVALVGLNSTRYLTLDVAIGLVGAVSVPLYYTSPPADLDAILEASGAKFLFVGTPRLLERLDELKRRLPVISFCREALPDGLTREVISWKAFLELGLNHESPSVAPVGLADLATLRYTSGTTGRPKGVTFNHAQLRWMAGTLAALLPWRARTRRTTSLSFLPMNHVVEGLLATYSPYMLPAPVDVYFLENFRELEAALPLVRPSFFFAVPRFYEKVWEAFAANPLGAWFSRLEAGPLRTLLRPVVRWLLLRRAGLERCAQLIVGSAPMDDGLLRAYRALGIEIHDAYGLTEAPLVTLNRSGANRIGTVGEPLPETELHIAEDGELLVRGPQVTGGYFGEAAQPFRDGWLMTGDLGSLTSESALVIEGRKKELIATAYGKKVQVVKVEELLKEIPGVAEAMLVGEQRPYCVALIWLETEAHGHFSGEALDRAVLEVNARLSHPEQVKAWAVLERGLSIEQGQLTANLKLKREVIARQLEGVIASLYSRADASPGVLHLGRAGHEERVAAMAG